MSTGISDTGARPATGARGDAATAGSATPAGPSGTPAPPAVSTAVVVATAPTDGGGPAALLPWEDATVLRQLATHLVDVGVADIRVVARTGWADDVGAALGGMDAVSVLPSEDLSSDRRAVATAAHEAVSGVIVLHGDIVTHRESLAGLVLDPRVATGILAGGARAGRPFAMRTRSSRGRVISAASPFHVVNHPTAAFLGVLKVAADDRTTLAAVAERLAGLTAGGLPEGWDDELERKEHMWRSFLGRVEARTALAADDLDSEGRGDADVRSGMGEDSEADDLALDAAGHDPEDETPVVLSEEGERELQRRVTAARNDVPALLLVGLVRSGAQVGNSHLRRLYWSRPLSSEGIDRATERYGDYDEDKVLLDSAVKATDGFFTTFFVSPYSKYIARWAAHRGLTPNQITTLSVCIGIVAAAAFATGERWGAIAGAILLQISFTTDCVDGQLARYSRQFSKLGAWLDSVFDRTKEYAVFAGLAIGASGFDQDVWLLAGAALTLQSVRHTFDFSFGAARHQVIGATTHQPLEQPSDRPVRAKAPAPVARTPAQDAEPVAAVDDAAGAPPVPLMQRLPRMALSVWRKLDKWPGLIWVKRMVAFPIGERFAVISITAALFTPQVTFIVLLAWGGFAAVYTLAGRFLRSVAR